MSATPIEVVRSPRLEQIVRTVAALVDKRMSRHVDENTEISLQAVRAQQVERGGWLPSLNGLLVRAHHSKRVAVTVVPGMNFMSLMTKTSEQVSCFAAA
jgi:hypothetical protein